MKRLFAFLLAALLATVASPALAVESNYGYDVSEPQCSVIGELPTPGAFNVVGVNGGRVFLSNPCLADQLLWAGSSAELYANTGNPGPNLSVRYTAGTVAGKVCSTTNLNSAACAFVYGYRAAADSYRIANEAFSTNGWSVMNARTWWLDVETSNSWRGLDSNLPSDNFLTSDQAQALNVANLQGAAYYFEAIAKVARLGIYSTNYQWDLITGSSLAFSDLASWKSVGMDGESVALGECATQPGFTGAPETRVQYIDTLQNLDVNVPCEFAKAASLTSYSGVKAVRASSKTTLRLNLKTALGTPMANQRVVITFNRKNYILQTNASGNAAKVIYAPRTKGIYKAKTTFSGNYLFGSSTSITNVRVY